MSLVEYSETQHTKPESPRDSLKSALRPTHGTTDQSLLLLSISTAANYYTTDAYLMKNPSPVFVDIILDPFILNVFPRSLIPTAGYITIVAIGSFFVARFMSRFLARVAKTDVQKKDK